MGKANLTHDDRQEAKTVDALWRDGLARGRVLTGFLEEQIGALDRLHVLDLGCASGGISLALAERACRVVGIDLSVTELRQAAARPAIETVKNEPEFLAASSLQLPFPDGSFDIALMIGVLEYMGRAPQADAPHTAHLDCCREAARVLGTSGHLVVAIENRWYPRFVVRSPHQGVLGGLLLPQAIAHRVTRVRGAGPMWELLHGFWGLQRLLRRAGFRRTSGFLPLYGYQFPKDIVPANDRRRLWRHADRAALCQRTGYEQVASGGTWGPFWFRTIAALGLQKLLAPALLIVGSK